jgi:predicted Zn-ribbon and HTH transcriptional regulator
MSFITSTLKCKKCGYEMNVAFGIQGSNLIAAWPERCSECNSTFIEKISDGWIANNDTIKK